MRLIRDDSGERSGWWFSRKVGPCREEYFIPDEAMAAIQAKERKRAARIASQHYDGGCGCSTCTVSCLEAMKAKILGKRPSRGGKKC